MQTSSVITSRILEGASRPLVKKAHRIVDELFELNYSLPQEVKSLRPSFLNFENVIKWGGNPEQAMSAAFSALNCKHGCFIEAYDFHYGMLTSSQDKLNLTVKNALKSGKKIPGFGSPIYKNVVRWEGIDCDQRMVAAESILKLFTKSEQHKVSSYVKAIIQEIHDHNHCSHWIKPNLVFWNVAISMLLGLPRNSCSMIFMMAITARYINESITLR